MKLKSLALAVALACSAPAFADTVLITGFTFNPATPLTVSSPSYSGPAGQFTGLLNGNSFATYCTDISQTFAFNTLYTDYTVVSGVAAWGAQKSLDLDRAVSAFLAAGFPANSAQSATAQAVVWEIIYEQTGNPYGFNAGTFQATSADAGTQSSLNTINWPALPLEPVTYHVDKLYSREHQDFLVITQVPEPGTYALFAAGLAGIGFIARRRTRQA